MLPVKTKSPSLIKGANDYHGNKGCLVTVTFVFLSSFVSFIHINDRRVKTFRFLYGYTLAELVRVTLHGVTFLLQEKRYVTGFALTASIDAVVDAIDHSYLLHVPCCLTTSECIVVGNSTRDTAMGLFRH